MKNYEHIQSLLMPTKKAADEDMVIFRAWERGDISTAKCLMKFRQHNKQNDSVAVSLSDFESWLYSLGYRRY